MKWSSTKWIHVGSLDESEIESGGCADSNPGCDGWAFAGECAPNLLSNEHSPARCSLVASRTLSLDENRLALVAKSPHSI